LTQLDLSLLDISRCPLELLLLHLLGSHLETVLGIYFPDLCEDFVDRELVLVFVHLEVLVEDRQIIRLGGFVLYRINQLLELGFVEYFDFGVDHFEDVDVVVDDIVDELVDDERGLFRLYLAELPGQDPNELILLDLLFLFGHLLK